MKKIQIPIDFKSIWNEHKSLIAVSKIMKVSHVTVRNWLAQLDIEPNNIGRKKTTGKLYKKRQVSIDSMIYEKIPHPKCKYIESSILESLLKDIVKKEKI